MTAVLVPSQASGAEPVEPTADGTDGAAGTAPAAAPKVSLIREFVRYGRGRLWAVAVLGLVSVAGTLAFPYLVGRLITAVQDGAGLLWPVTLMVLAGIGGAAAGAGATYLVGRIGEQVVLQLRTRTIEHAVGMRVGDLRTEGVGNIATRLTADSFQVKAAIDIAPLQLPTAALTLLGTLAIMGFLDPVLLLVTLGSFVLAFVVIGVLMAGLRRKYRALQDGVGELSDVFVSQMQSVVAIKANRAEGRLAARLNELAHKLSRLGTSATASESLIVPAVTLGQQIALVGVLVGGGARVVSGEVTLAVFIAFLLYLLQLVSPIVMAVSGLTTIQSGMIARSRFDEVLAQPQESDDDPVVPAVPQTDDPGAPAVRLTGVRFEHLPGEPVLDGVDLDIPQRGLTALVGRSGAGKSTLFQLIERFHRVQEGRIELWGSPTERLTLDQLRSRIAYVDQTFTLLHGSIRENLLLGTEGEIDEGRLHEVLAAVGLRDEIERLPEGLDTVIGAAADLSGGQRQRLALARAMLSDAPLVLLDEPSSQLDGLNEDRLRTCVRELARDRAVLMIAHRLSTVRDASAIVVLQEGRVVAEGTHEELLRFSPEYNLLANEQLAGASS